MIDMRTIKTAADLRGCKVTVMGLGLNGGGLASARFLAEQGAIVTVTDMQNETQLAPTIAQLEGLPIRFVLGKHELDDFRNADIVIKNPAVRPDSPFLQVTQCVESDISLFLRFSRAPIIAVTGSKGKSTTVSALQHGLKYAGKNSFLGGNITVSPLTFLAQTNENTPVVLELSSWQLADLKGKKILKPYIALFTSMMPDHMNRYTSMDDYMADKALMYADQDERDYTVCNFDDDWNRQFASYTKAKVRWYADALAVTQEDCAYLDQNGRGIFNGEEIIPIELSVPGQHQRKNLLGAALALRLFGIDAKIISASMASFPGVEHRLELCAQKNGVKWYNDSAATIPQAVVAAITSLEKYSPIVLITGGTDKNLEFESLIPHAHKPKAIVLLAGSGTDKLLPLLNEKKINYHGPFDNLHSAVTKAAELANKGDTVIFSPGCTSFGMFKNEFDRGNQFKKLVQD